MPTGPIVLVFAVVFGVVVGAFWLFVQRPEQQSTQALRRRLKREREDIDEDAEDALIERQPKHDRRRLEGIAASAGGGVLRYVALQLSKRDRPLFPALAFPQDRRIRARDVPIQAVVDDVQLSTNEPRRPLDAVRCVEHPIIGSEPLDPCFCDHAGPQFLQVIGRVAQEFFAIV